jgi:hypothetical protein
MAKNNILVTHSLPDNRVLLIQTDATRVGGVQLGDQVLNIPRECLGTIIEMLKSLDALAPYEVLPEVIIGNMGGKPLNEFVKPDLGAIRETMETLVDIIDEAEIWRTPYGRAEYDRICDWMRRARKLLEGL